MAANSPFRLNGQWCCIDCHKPIDNTGYHGGKVRPARRCPPCRQTRSRANDAVSLGAHKVVACAVRSGVLPSVRTCVCVDCGAPAVHYDHRDYRKPLEVEPVCRRCNYRRGPALGLPMPDKGNQGIREDAVNPARA